MSAAGSRRDRASPVGIMATDEGRETGRESEPARERVRAHCSKPSGSLPLAALEKPLAAIPARGSAEQACSSRRRRPTALASAVSRAPYSALASSPVSARVVIAARRRSRPIPTSCCSSCAARSILPMSPASRLPKSNPPPGAAGSATRTPSISTSSCSASAPRTRTPVKLPGAPLRLKLTPGRAREHAREIGPLHRLDLLAADHRHRLARSGRASVGAPVAVTVIWSSDRSCARAIGRTDAAAKATAKDKQIFQHRTSRTTYETAVHRREGRAACRAHVLRLPPVHPARGPNDGHGQVSWLAGSLPRACLPDPASGDIGARLPGHSCGGSSGFAPNSLSELALAGPASRAIRDTAAGIASARCAAQSLRPLTFAMPARPTAGRRCWRACGGGASRSYRITRARSRPILPTLPFLDEPRPRDFHARMTRNDPARPVLAKRRHHLRKRYAALAVALSVRRWPARPIGARRPRSERQPSAPADHFHTFRPPMSRLPTAPSRAERSSPRLARSPTS